MCEPENVVGKIESGRGEIVIVGMYSTGMERSENERDAFWECFNECINYFSENERIVVLSDMNEKVEIGKYVTWLESIVYWE